MPLKTKINKKIKKRNTKKRIFRRKKTKRKNSKKRKTRRMRGGATNKLTAQQKDQLLQATTDEAFFKFAIDHFGYTKPQIHSTVRKNSVIQMLTKLKEKVEELEKLKSDKEGVDSDLVKINQELETLNTMASNDQKQKPPGEFSPKFNTIADKLVDLHKNVDELNGKLAQLQSALDAKGTELETAQEEHASALTQKEGELKTAQEEHASALAKKEGELKTAQQEKEEVNGKLETAQSELAAKEDELKTAQSALDAKEVSSSSEKPQQCYICKVSSNYRKECCDSNWDTLTDGRKYDCQRNRIK